jgi:hypothetical protein
MTGCTSTSRARAQSMPHCLCGHIGIQSACPRTSSSTLSNGTASKRQMLRWQCKRIAKLVDNDGSDQLRLLAPGLKAAVSMKPMPHEIEEALINVLMTRLQNAGHHVVRIPGTFDLEVDGQRAEVKTKSKCFDKLDFISLTDKQHGAGISMCTSSAALRRVLRNSTKCAPSNCSPRRRAS